MRIWRPCGMAVVILTSTAALARDADLQSALLAAGCPVATISTVSKSAEGALYAANCFSTSHRIVAVFCSKTACTVTSKPAS